MTDQSKIQEIARRLWIEAAQANSVRRQSLEYQLTMAIKAADGFETEGDRCRVKFHLRKVYMLHATVAEFLDELEESITAAEFAEMDEEDAQERISEFMDDYLHDEIDTFKDAASIACASIRWCGR